MFPEEESEKKKTKAVALGKPASGQRPIRLTAKLILWNGQPTLSLTAIDLDNGPQTRLTIYPSAGQTCR